jgi:hypothetical protein
MALRDRGRSRRPTYILVGAIASSVSLRFLAPLSGRHGLVQQLSRSAGGGYRLLRKRLALICNMTLALRRTGLDDFDVIHDEEIVGRIYRMNADREIWQRHCPRGWCFLVAPYSARRLSHVDEARGSDWTQATE